MEEVKRSANNYHKISKIHDEEFYLESDAHIDAESKGIEVGYKKRMPW